jgi:hypothetical protein
MVDEGQRLASGSSRRSRGSAARSGWRGPTARRRWSGHSPRRQQNLQESSVRSRVRR